VKILGIGFVLALLPSLAVAGVCDGVKAEVSLASVSFADGVMKASGTWNVGEGGQGVIIEYRIQSDRQALEIRPGASGEWSVELPYTRCGRNTFQVQAFPLAKTGEVQGACLESGSKALRDFDIDCRPKATLGPCRWECVGEKDQPARCSGTCQAAATGGVAAFVGMFRIADRDFQVLEGPERGPWSLALTCSPGERIEFKVRDHFGTGAFSNVAEAACGKE
jgi:hypothetical protein